MDIATITGIILGILMIGGAIVFGGAPSAFISVPSILVTVGGTTAALLITFPVKKIKSVFIYAKKTLKAGNLDLTPWYNTILDLAIISRRDGLLALEEKLEDFDDPFLTRGLQMVIDGSSPETVSSVMDDEIENLEARHSVGHAIFANLGTFAPAFGMIGTLIGLVQMLRNLDDPSKIGEGMATALLTTFYGALLANLFALPMQGKLQQRTEEEVNLKRMLAAGISGIQAGESPRAVGHKLLTYMPPAQREKVQQESQ